LIFVSRRMSRGSFKWTLAAVTAIFVIATMYVSTAAIASRVGTVFSTQFGGRLDVWQQTWPIATDFPWVGVGVGAFERAMSVYQQSTHLMFINHAHNEYLQWLTEGGLALMLPAGVAIAAGVARILHGLPADRSAMFMVRAGAVSALAAVAAQSIWDTGLRLPANAVLCAIAAAIALHDRQQASGGGAGRHHLAAPVRPKER
jgi:O-antigen ligase